MPAKKKPAKQDSKADQFDSLVTYLASLEDVTAECAECEQHESVLFVGWPHNAFLCEPCYDKRSAE